MTHEKLTPKQIERLTKLVVALKSGKYKQTFNQLRIKDSFCCLGVACDIYGKVQRKNFWNMQHESNFTFLKTTGILPSRVCHWFGFESTTGFAIRNGTLITLNDELRFNFIAIAYVIECYIQQGLVQDTIVLTSDENTHLDLLTSEPKAAIL